MADVELTVIGAGVVGLAVAARLAPRHPAIVVLERRSRHGTEASSRNSEVIHAGLYYAAESLKARLCVEGNARLYAFCEKHRLPHRRIGKIIVATRSDEEPVLDDLLTRARANGAQSRLITGQQVRGLEPAVPAVAALSSPDTGILSADALMDCLKALTEAAGGTVSTSAEVVGLHPGPGGFEVVVRSGQDTESFTTERVVNAAGAEADHIAAMTGIDVDAAGCRQHLWKGSYFAAAPRLRGSVSRLVYPVPDATSLGVHVVLDMSGRLRFGPDAEYLPDRATSYVVDPARRAAFASSARRLIPHLRDEDLVPDTCGVRAKLQAPGGPARDFVIRDEAEHGLPGLINLVGIDSPGLTSSLAIADYVAGLVEGTRA